MEQFIDWWMGLIPEFEPRWLFVQTMITHIGLSVGLGFSLPIVFVVQLFKSADEGYLSKKYPKISGVILVIIFISIIVLWFWLGTQDQSYRPPPKHPYDF